MGSKCSTIQLDESEIEEIKKETGFSVNQIKRLYSRFTSLDKDNKASLCQADLLRIPELAINPLGKRIVKALFAPPADSDEDGINFHQFVSILARFRRATAGQKGNDPLNTHNHKLEYAFKMYDDDNTGLISKENIQLILSRMVGTNKSSEQLAAIADRILLEVDTDNDGFINFEEFKVAMEKTDFQTKMSIRFLA